MNFGEKLKAARLDKGYTLSSLSVLLGVAKSTLAGYENGSREPDLFKIKKLINLLDVDPDYLLGVERKTSPLSESQEIARAYEVADPGTQAAVRKLLDVKKPPHIPDMEKVRREAEAFASKLREPTKK